MLLERSVVALVVLAGLACPRGAEARQTSGDDALQRLLKKVEEPQPAADPPPDKPAKLGEVTPEDRDLDSLLRKLGETDEKPEASGKPEAPDDPKGDPRPRSDSGPGLEGRDKALDEHLEELTGRKKKKKPTEESGASQGEENSPLKDAIKRMEEVRKRLSESDTGEGTRREQDEIVKELDQILQKLRQQRGQQSRTAMRSRQQGQGRQPGEGEGDQPNETGAGVGASRPKAATVGQMLAGRKDTWGDLPPALREELENVFKTDMLPSRSELIRRYYSAVARKGRNGAEGSR